MMKEKKSHGVQLLLRMLVKDPDGKVLSDTKQKPAKSFVIQFLKCISGLLSGDTVTAKRVSAAVANIYFSGVDIADFARIDAPINEDGWGILVGTGDTAETNTDYKLETQLTEGAGAGNITHGEQVIETTGVVGANVDLETKRAFSNNTGSAITVKEAGIYMWYGGVPYLYCIIRDVLAPPIEVPDRCSLTVYYTYRTTV